MTAARRRLGTRGEELAARHLASRGARIVERNARTRHGELDLIALEGGVLVFVEVKTTRSGTAAGPLLPVHAVGPRKRLRIRRLARAWLAEHDPPLHFRELRFDVIGIVLDGGGRILDLEHLEGAF